MLMRSQGLVRHLPIHPLPAFMSQPIQVGLVQMTCSSDAAANRQKAITHIEAAAAQGAQIVCLQELFTSLYFCDIEHYDNFLLAEAIPDGPSVQALRPVAERLGVVIIASLFEKRTAGVYHNTVAVIDADGQYLGKYRKQHIPDDPGYYEKFYFTPGDHGYQVFTTKYAKIGVLICWDQWYPEAARITALKGAEMLFYPTAIGWHQSQTPDVNDEQFQAWRTIQRSHSVANGVPVIAVNRVGNEGEMTFWGGSFITNPFGRILYEASHDQEEVHVEAIDLSQSDYYRTHWPFLRDRRVDTYQPLTQRFLED
jgi:N-carbamoylputrescine amidase